MKSNKSKPKNRESRARRSRRSQAAKRRGVLLLVVLSMLVLFMLVGTAFLMSSNQSREAMKDAAKQNRLGDLATRNLDRAMLQLVRDTQNQNSVIRYHSLLRDVYGTDGFQGVVYVPDFATEAAFITRYSQATGTPLNPMGPTNGQFIDIYVSQRAYITSDGSNAVDYSVQYDGTKYALDLRNVLRLDRNPYGQAQPYPLPLTKGYFNGCLLTITSGPAAGKSTRILDYECLAPEYAKATATTSPTRMFRFRVMAFQRSDGQSLVVNTDTGAKGRPPELSDLAGQSFIVNGRAFSGTGVGYNPLAQTGQPRLSALQLFPIDGAGGFVSAPITKTTNYIGAELALLPNAAYFNPASTSIPVGAAAPGIPDPFNTATPLQLQLGNMQLLNDPNALIVPKAPFFNYPSYVGSGGPNEGYDAADFQNIFLALQTVTPRSQGRVVHTGSASPLDVTDPLVLSDTNSFLRLDLEDLPIPSFHRPDLVNFWNHRLLRLLTDPAGLYKLNADDAVRAIVQPYMDDQWNIDSTIGGLTPQLAALISAVKRQTMLRPTREDHPHFDGGNPMSIPPTFKGVTPLTKNGNITVPTWEVVGPWDVDNDNDGVRDSVWVDLGDPILETEDGRRYKTLYSFLCVDLDSRLNVNAHGLADDLVPPLLDTTKANYFDATKTSGAAGNLVHDLTNVTPTTVYSTLQLPRGLGYGPPEISLRPLFPAPLDASFNPIFPAAAPFRPNQAENLGPVDSYATLLFGRLKQNGEVVDGRYGSDLNLSAAQKAKNPSATAGTNYEFDRIPNSEPLGSPRRFTGERATPSLLAQLKFFDYPWSFWDAWSGSTLRNYQSAFGTMPDLKGRYALGLDYAGQPVYEVANDWNPMNARAPANPNLPITNQGFPFNLLANTPYELNLSGQQRRDNWASATNNFGPLSDSATAFNTSVDRSFDPAGQHGLNDDAPFSPTDLEKVLRGWDADHGTLPSRLWDVASEFDPLKLRDYDPNRVQQAASVNYGSTTAPAILAAAQELAGISRRLVTTDSYDLPVANQEMPAYVSDYGPDGAPGRRGQPNQVLNLAGTDDFQAIMGISRAQAKITDLLRYRVWLEARRYEMNRQQLTEAKIDALSPANYATFMNQIKARADFVMTNIPNLISDLLAPEVIAGKRMDLNRPFGNGKDDPDPTTGLGDGVVDDPMEAGEPFLDVNGNGKRDDGTNGPVEPFIDLNGDGIYQGPRDVLWPELSPTTANPPGNGTLAEPITFDYTNGHAEPISKRVESAMVAALQPIKGGVRNLDSQGRQLFARHLYCLALLLMDENYIAPWDEKDPQINKLLDQSIDGSFAQRLRIAIGGAIPKPETPDSNLYRARVRAMLLRKLTCRSLAQWAVNCVDMRDPDVIMTPFEYDENPWDGWGEWDDHWNDDPDPANTTSKFKTATFLPLDGDPATNENDAWVINWSTHTPANPGGPKAFARLLFIGGQPKVSTNAPTTTNPPIVTVPFNQTRGVVWGAERPELLITETLAWHDRRTEDLFVDGRHDALKGTSTTRYVDTDLDQRLRPKGSLFVELYNPWSPDGQLPAELYTRFDSTTNYQRAAAAGVDLSRLSNFGVRESFDPHNIPIASQAVLTQAPSNGIIKRSPVWRLIVVDDWPRARNRERARIGDKNKSQTAVAPFTGYSQRLGDVPPDVKVNLPAGVTVTGGNLPTYLQPMVGTSALKDTVEGWDVAQQPPPYRAPDPDLEDVFNAGFFNAAGVFTKFDGGFNAGFTPTQVKTQAPGSTPNVNLFNVEYPYIEREFYFTTDDSPTVAVTGSAATPPWCQFITAGSRLLDWDYSPKAFKLRVPDRFVLLSGFSPTTLPKGPDLPPEVNYSLSQPGSVHPTGSKVTWARTQKFIPIGLEKQKSYQNLDLTVTRANPQPVVAPILPGRYGVIGTAGTRYFKDPANQNIYTDAIGRSYFGDPKFTKDSDLANSLKPPTKPTDQQPRRIEIRPSNNPDLQQLIVASNGGDPKDQLQKSYDPFATEIGRDNELIRNDKNNTVDNLTTPDNNGKARYYQPCVAIPIEGMSASDPPWSWITRECQAADQEYEIAKAEKAKNPSLPDPSPIVYSFNARAANGEGAYQTTNASGTIDVSFDKPFDLAPELSRTGTTPNYRTTHLQRLANPELPWNPPPGEYKDATGADIYRPNLPVNPYRTIDSSTVNLTAFNGTSSNESIIGNSDNRNIAEGKLRPWVSQGGGTPSTTGKTELDEYLEQTKGVPGTTDPENTTQSAKQIWSFRSVERGFWSRLSTAGWIGTTPANQGASVPQRNLWAQEPALVELRQPQLPTDPYAQLLDLVAGRQMSTRYVDEVPRGQGTPPGNPAFGPMDNLESNPNFATNPSTMTNFCDAVLKHSLGFGNESFGLLYDKVGARRANFPTAGPKGSAAPLPAVVGAPAPSRFPFPYDVNPSNGSFVSTPATLNSTYPWMEWDNRPFVSADELLNVPATSQSQLLRRYSTVDPNVAAKDRYSPYGLASLGLKPNGLPPKVAHSIGNSLRWNAMQAQFGALVNLFASSSVPADVVRDTDFLASSDADPPTPFTGYTPQGIPVRFDPTGVPLIPDDPTKEGNIRPYGAANLTRLLDYVQVPSRFTGTDTLLNAETFNDVPPSMFTPQVGTSMTAAQATPLGTIDYDARFFFQPPFNKVSRERDPGKVNLNTVTGRRLPPQAAPGDTTPRIWSEVFDGIMHRGEVFDAVNNRRYGDMNPANQLSHFGPAWRDVVLSRRGYAQYNADNSSLSVERLSGKPDVFEAGLNPLFPTIFANPFRSADAGDLVPLPQMLQYGVDASILRKHPYDRSLDPTQPDPRKKRRMLWGQATPQFGDARDAGLGANETISLRAANGAIPDFEVTTRDTLPLFSEARDQPFADTNRNPYMMYEPMSRLGNLVTNRSGVYAVWITVGYFEVEPAPTIDPTNTTNWGNKSVFDHFGGDINLYNRAYPDGYMLGKELGSETGDVKRPRGFYIIDRTEEVGFKPGEDLNVEKAVRLRRRIE